MNDWLSITYINSYTVHKAAEAAEPLTPPFIEACKYFVLAVHAVEDMTLAGNHFKFK